MNNKAVGAILLSASGLVAAVGAVGSQIASAIVEGLFYTAKMGGSGIPHLKDASPHWTVTVMVVLLAGLGIFFVFRPTKTE